jgi:hypothetical protein
MPSPCREWKVSTTCRAWLGGAGTGFGVGGWGAGVKGLAGASRKIPSILLAEVVAVLHGEPTTFHASQHPGDGEIRIVPALGALAALGHLQSCALIQYNLY